MGGKSSSKSSKTYNTTNISQQSEGANIAGNGNAVNVYRADAITLDNIAKTLGEGTREITGNAATMADGAFDLSRELGSYASDINRESLSFAESINADSLNLADETLSMAERMNADSLGFADRVNRDSLNMADRVNADSLNMADRVNRDSLSFADRVNSDSINAILEIAQGAEESTQQAMSFADNFSTRAQTGNSSEATKTVFYVAAVAGVALVGVAIASKGGIR